ncbi:hypothetical protein [Chryseobacterium sp. HR92]|uniref:hypothetical protein n=1 Tax=Chryseobacterium sp. HR92 TaxID=3094839 RepID=UPI00388F8022|nr:hypothetical protein SFA27_16820 [Chryseobacterium sp. HR92]
MENIKNLIIPFVSVLTVFYLVGAFINGTFNSALWNEIFKAVLASIAIMIGGVTAVLYKMEIEDK